LIVRVFIYGAGPRTRRIAAALVRDALPQALIRTYEQQEAAERDASATDGPFVLLDARVAVEPETFRRFALEAVSLSARARLFDGSTAWSTAARRFPDGAALRVPIIPMQCPDPIGAWLEEPEQPATPPRRAGVDFHGYGKGPSGFATASRNLMIGLERAGIDVNWLAWLHEMGDAEIVPQDRKVLEHVETDQVRHDRAIVFHPPTHTSGQDFIDAYSRAYVRVPFAFATMFETDGIPAQWTKSIVRCSRLWVPSAFNVETFAAGGVPREMIDLVPIGLDIENQPIDGPTLELPERRTLAFLSVFEWTFRKGWDVLFGAWAKAFNRNDDVCLIVRTSFRDVDMEAAIRRCLEWHGHDAAKVAPIIVLPKKISQSQLVALYRSADAYVLPSRGEGFGLPYLEAMALGLPVIGTAWSGMTDFVDAQTGYLIDARLAPITSPMISRIVPIYKDQRWAEPSIDSTAREMRRIFEHREEAQIIAARGTVVARTQFNRTRIGRIAADALSKIVPRRLTVRVPGSSGAIAFDAPIYHPDGTGSDARGFLRALHEQHRYTCAISNDGDRTWIGLVDHLEARVIKAGLQAHAEGAPTLEWPSTGHASGPSSGGARIARVVATAQTLSEASIDHLRRFDQLWVPSQFSVELFARAGIEPARIALVPPAIDVERWIPQIGGLEIAPNATALRLLGMVDWDERSGWELTLGAFLRAFSASDDVLLVLKACARDPRAPVPQYQDDVMAAVRTHWPDKLATIGSYPINLMTGMSPGAHLSQYYGSFDALICSAREIGWGRPMLEAMSCGTVVVAPRAGNHRAFVTEDNAFLYDAKPTSRPTVFEPDVDQLALILRRIYDRRDELGPKAHLARRMVSAQHSLSVAGAAAAARIEALVDRTRRAAGFVTETFPKPAPELGVIVDARQDRQHLPRALDLIERSTRSDYSVIIAGPPRGDGTGTYRSVTKLGEAFAHFKDMPYVAYLRSDAIVMRSWDDFLIEALRVRPYLGFAVPRTFDVPSLQADLLPGEYDVSSVDVFRTFAQFVSLTHTGFGTTLDTFSTLCLVFERTVLDDALKRAGPSFDSIDHLARAALSGGRKAWCAQDSIVQHSGSAGRSMIELRLATASR
jgi:glycosyltransferase involved in cell wall biosynthesis